MIRWALAIALISPFARAGDPSQDFDALVGRWKPRSCADAAGLKKSLPNLSIGATGPRSFFVNVYQLDSNGKKSKLYFSTYESMSQKGIFKLTKDLSRKNGIHVQLKGPRGETVIQITAVEKKRLQLLLKTQQKTLTCELLPL